MKRSIGAVPSVSVPLRNDLDPFRRRLERAGASSTEAVLVDFVEDDLLEAKDALASIADYVAEVEVALGDPCADRARIAALAQRDSILGCIDGMAETLGSLRRRLGHIAARWPSSERGEVEPSSRPSPSPP